MNSDRLATILEKVLDIGNLLNEGELVAVNKKRTTYLGPVARGARAELECPARVSSWYT